MYDKRVVIGNVRGRNVDLFILFNYVLFIREVDGINDELNFVYFYLNDYEWLFEYYSIWYWKIIRCLIELFGLKLIFFK